jgi:polysaccharide export outer membrane protein
MFVRLCAAALAAVCTAGCGNKFLDPTQIGRFEAVPTVNVILDSLGVADETPVAWEQAEEPKPIDVMAFESDYVINPGDVVQITIFELLQEGAPLANNYLVTETGRVSIPEVGIVQAAGLTETQLEEELRQILSPSILKDPNVTVTVVSSQQRTYSILGNGVPGPGRYQIPRYDFRLLDALATAGGIGQFNISYVYVSRSLEGTEQEAGFQEGWPQEFEDLPPERQMLEVITPRAQKLPRTNGLIITSAEMVTDEELSEAALPEGFEPAVQEEQSPALPEGFEAIAGEDRDLEPQGERRTIAPPIEPEPGGVEWVFEDGRWVPRRLELPPAERARPTRPPRSLARSLPLGGWDQLGEPAPHRRVIRIPADKLLAGDPRYNIVVRPNDTIHVPVDLIGEFGIMGNVNGQGFINLTGRPMTLKMAIAAAGGLGPLAWPKRCEVVRRISKDKEEIVMVDLEKIARGEQPDFFIKPNDLINVGTHPTARWRAVLRNSFRATYGFGFIYDRNFADRDVGTRRPIPDWF